MQHSLSPQQSEETTPGQVLDTPYAHFDRKMLCLIKASPMTAAAITTALKIEAKPFMRRANEEFRVIDRRLQALRKKGLITWERRGAFVVWTSNGKVKTE